MSRLIRKDYMVGPEHIAKLEGLKKETGASHSHFVRKGIETLSPKKRCPDPPKQSKRATARARTRKRHHGKASR